MIKTVHCPAIVPGLPQRHGTGGHGQQPDPPQDASDKTSGSVSTSMPSSASSGIPPEPPSAYGPAIVPGLPQRHGTGGPGQQPAPPQGSSDKTSGSISTSMPSSASPGISLEPPAVHGPLPGDDETARHPSLVSRLSPLAASKRPAGALSPTNAALFPALPCTAECCLKGASHMPGALPPEGAPATQSAGFPPAPPRSTERARGPFYLFLDRIPPSEGGQGKIPGGYLAEMGVICEWAMNGDDGWRAVRHHAAAASPFFGSG